MKDFLNSIQILSKKKNNNETKTNSEYQTFILDQFDDLFPWNMKLLISIYLIQVNIYYAD